MSGFFINIVNMSISASWIVLAVLLLRLVFRKAPKWITVLPWGIVAIRLICPFSIESVMSLIPSAETISPQILIETPEINTGIPFVNNTLNPIIEDSVITIAPEKSISTLQLLVLILSKVWIIGVVLLLAYTVFSYWRVCRKVGTAVLLRENIYQSETVISPFVLGIVKPKIYIPFDLSEKDIGHVIAHERAHICRKDHWWKPLGFLLLALHWFNPLIWIGYVLLCRDIELACDEKVVKELNTEQRADYSQALLTCSVDRRIIAACPLAFGEVGVKDRVKSVLNYKKPAFWIIVAAIVASITVAVCFLTNPKKEKKLGIEPQSSRSELDGISIEIVSSNLSEPDPYIDITFKAIELVYNDILYSFVQTVENAPTYQLVNGMQLLEQYTGNEAELIGGFEEITLNENNFDSRFKHRTISWMSNIPFDNIKQNNKRAWQLYCDSSNGPSELYILLEQNDGTFYLGYGYFNGQSSEPSNTDDSHIRWFYRLEKAAGM